LECNRGDDTMTILRIGTRGSPLALAQTREVITALEHNHPSLKGRTEVVALKTTGDTIVDRSLTDVGGKSLFTKEIEMALLKGEIDLAVHSMKDVAADLPQGLVFPAMLEREDPRDALITRNGALLEDLPPGSLFGTSSLRRQVYVLHHYPHLHITLLRGNVATRLEKIMTGAIGATLLAVAGLKRLGLLEMATKILGVEECLPAIAQGAIGMQCREEDKDVLELLAPLNHLTTFQAVSAERAFLKALNGSCRTPMAGYGYIEGETLVFKGMISEPNGENMRFIVHQGPVADAPLIGREAAQKIKDIKCTVSC
jgi:hydroxymethylbilane synthase